jgi:hypothetical protein
MERVRGAGTGNELSATVTVAFGHYVRSVDDPNRFGIVLRCVAHFSHHIGQIIDLVKEHAREHQMPVPPTV